MWGFIIEFGQFCLCVQLQYWYLTITIQAKGFTLYRFQLIFKYHVPVYKIMAWAVAVGLQHFAPQNPRLQPNQWMVPREHRAYTKMVVHFFLVSVCIYCKTNVGILKITSNARNTNQITNWILNAFKTDKRETGLDYCTQLCAYYTASNEWTMASTQKQLLSKIKLNFTNPNHWDRLSKCHSLFVEVISVYPASELDIHATKCSLNSLLLTNRWDFYLARW
jgi:hypothetical protein